jgi:CubicO group peptidase (beta-lactamase class C family)
MPRLAMKVVWLATLLVASTALAAPPADLDSYAQKALQTFGTPGMTVAIVEQGKPYVVRSYGVRRLGEPAKVDEHTLFAIGSTTKAFTTALLAMLVDEGKLTWETKVADVLPGFRMYDPYVSSRRPSRGPTSFTGCAISSR